MIGDRPIALLTLFAATFLHLVVFVLASYVPYTKLETHPPLKRTRYVVQFQQPAPIKTPTAVPMVPTPIPPSTPVQPVPVKPLPIQPSQMPHPVRITPQRPQPTAIEVQRPEPLARPVEIQRQPRQPTLAQEPVRVNPRRELPSVNPIPRPKPVDRVQRPKQVVARKPAAVKVQKAQKPPVKTQRPKQTPPLKPSPPRQPVTPREPIVSRPPTPRPSAPPARPATRPPQPATPPQQDLQRLYQDMVFEAIKKHKRYPRMARRRGLSGKVVVAFVILPDGQVTEVRIIASQSTRHTMLHKAALRAIKRASPLPPFPKALKKASWPMTLPILYELTER